jgi:hypothetical protein
MGDVIAFPQSNDRPRARVIGQDEPRGLVLLFLGVRYERHDGEPQTPAEHAGRKGVGRAERTPRRRKRG